MDNLKPYEEEAYFRTEALKKTIVGACMQLHFQKWLKEEEGVDKLDAWFQQYPQHYDFTHAKFTTEEEE